MISKGSLLVISLILVVLGVGFFECLGVQAPYVVPTSGTIDYPSFQFRSDFVVNGKWWSLSTVNSYMYNLSVAFPSFVRREKIGTSCNGYGIYALIIGVGPKYMITDSAIHGNEKAGAFGALNFANCLISSWNDPYWNSRLREITVIIVPVLNPDGFVKDTFVFDPPDGGGLNGDGSNLNRDFPPGVLNTTAPEAVAYLNLWAKYPPSILVSDHTGETGVVYWSQ